MKTQNTDNNTYVSTDKLDRKWIDVNIPCSAACPVMTDIPGYIQAIKDGDYKTAYRINRIENIFCIPLSPIHQKIEYLKRPHPGKKPH